MQVIDIVEGKILDNTLFTLIFSNPEVFKVFLFTLISAYTRRPVDII